MPRGCKSNIDVDDGLGSLQRVRAHVASLSSQGTV